MNPTNKFRLTEAVLSVMAGDVFRHTAARVSLTLFKAIYYLKSVLEPRSSLAAWRWRKEAIKPAEPAHPAANSGP